MGISGLLPLLREAQRSGHIEEFSGQTVGVDSYIWLYKGAFGCSTELALNKPTTKYITFFMNRARMLRHYGVRPYFVFDGGPLPSKQHTEIARKQSRMEKRQQGIRLWNQGKKKQAFEQFTRSIEVTPEMAKEVIKELEREGFEYVVAPFEADAQLAYLESKGLISAAISEDSDLIVFGCRNVIFKLDQYGEATVFDRSLLDQVKAVDIAGWSSRKIRHMCILSGCDYIASVPGVGLKKAYRYVARSSSLDMAVELMRADRLQVPEDYGVQVARAELTFMYQRVYDPVERRLDHVGPLGLEAPPIEEMPFLGDTREPEVAQGIAMGRIDPITLVPFGQKEPVRPLDFVEGAAASVSASLTVCSGSSGSSCSSGSSVSSPAPPASSPKHGGYFSSLGSAKKQPARKTAVPVSRAKSLLSFWAKPKQKTESAAAASMPSANPSVSVSVSVSVSASGPGSGNRGAVVVIDDEVAADAAACEDEVRVKFRAKDSVASELVATSQQSRFFTPGSRQEQTERPLKPESSSAASCVSAITTPQQNKQHASQSSQPSFVWPNTPAELVQSQEEEMPMTPTQIETTSQALQLSVSQDLLATSPLVSQAGSSSKGVYYLFDQFTGRKRPLPFWAIHPQYHK